MFFKYSKVHRKLKSFVSSLVKSNEKIAEISRCGNKCVSNCSRTSENTSRRNLSMPCSAEIHTYVMVYMNFLCILFVSYIHIEVTHFSTIKLFL
jgi:hypothetical protein